MTGRTGTIGIVGAGIGGLAAAAFLRRQGLRVKVFEQAARFARVGAGIQMAPNRHEGAARARRRGRAARAWRFRARGQSQPRMGQRQDDQSAEAGRTIEERYGAPYLLLHRADLHAAIERLVPPMSVISFGRKLVGIDAGRAHGDADFRRRHARAGRCGDRRGRRAFGGARGDARQGGAALHRPRRLSHHVSGGACSASARSRPSRTKWWGPTGTWSSITSPPIATRSISSPASRRRPAG